MDEAPLAVVAHPQDVMEHRLELMDARFAQMLAALVILGIFGFLFMVFRTGGVDLHDAIVASLVTLVINNSFTLLMLIAYHYWWRSRGMKVAAAGFAGSDRRTGTDRRETTTA